MCLSRCPGDLKLIVTFCLSLSRQVFFKTGESFVKIPSKGQWSVSIVKVQGNLEGDAGTDDRPYNGKTLQLHCCIMLLCCF